MIKMKKLILPIILFFLISCDEILNDNDSNGKVTITITSLGGSTDGTSWKRGNVVNGKKETIINVRINAYTNIQSVTFFVSPNVLSPGSQGTFYTGKLKGQNITLQVQYD